MCALWSFALMAADTLFPSSNQLFPLSTEAPRALLTRGKHDITKTSSPFLSLFPCIHLHCFFTLSLSLLFSLFLSFPLQPPSSSLAEQQRYYRRHMVQNQNHSQASPGLFSYASSSFWFQTEFLQQQDESWPNSH